jgi:molybdopterin synthase catalytic subunit
VFSYTKILKGHVRDERPATGVKILLDIYFRNANNEIIELIKQIYNNKRFYELTVAHCTKLPFEFCNFI